MSITDTVQGTSYAAPQVTGLAAMLLQEEPLLKLYPEAVRAILLASATKNIESLQGIPRNSALPVGDLKDGAGQIDAVQAIRIANTALSNDTVACENACWWYKGTRKGEGDIIRYFTGKARSHVRVAIAWWSNADNDTNDYSFDRLDTDFDLRIEYEYPSGSWATVSPAASSVSQHNNYELLDVLLTGSGNYRIVIPQTAVYNDEKTNGMGIAMALYKNIYLPTIKAK